MSRPLQNRVRPDGEVAADPARGLFMGNRGGRLHDETQRLGRARWRGKAWIVCLLHFKDRKRQVMGPGYTELFFLDEVTALAAGHRPCFECRRQAALRFAAAAGGMRATAMDRLLHAQRRAPRPLVAADAVPAGAMVAVAGRFHARTSAGWLEWHPQGYRAAGPPAGKVTLLTPELTLKALSAGYEPVWHPSALASS